MSCRARVSQHDFHACCERARALLRMKVHAATATRCMCFANGSQRFVAWLRRVSARRLTRSRSHECLELPHAQRHRTRLMQRSERRFRVKLRVIIVRAVLRLDWNQAHASDREIAPERAVLTTEHGWEQPENDKSESPLRTRAAYSPLPTGLGSSLRGYAVLARHKFSRGTQGSML
jgi:hypothetical protein